MFDELSISKLGFYVYGLIDPYEDVPFYIGKGFGNRVFQHAKGVKLSSDSSLKSERIKALIDKGLKIKHVIIRHGLTEKEAFEVDASLIDFSNKFQHVLTNQVDGHHSGKRGLMSTDEIIRLNNAKPLLKLSDNAIIININKKFERGNNFDDIYLATKEAWVVSETRIKNIKYALSEYRGVIIEVFEIDKWYRKNINESNQHIVPGFDELKKKSKRWGFNGKVADQEFRQKYINKSITHIKKKGAANPIRYKL